MQEQVRNIGADVGKFEIVVADAGGSGTTQLRNDKRTLSRWIETVEPGSCLAMEASGGYHSLLADLAHAHGLQVYVLNPKHVHHYASALGHRGKTDRLDAQVIAQYVSQHRDRLRCYEPEPPALKQLRELQALRSAVVKSATMLKLSKSRLEQADPQGLVQSMIEQLETLAQTLQKQLVQQAKQTPGVSQGYELLTTIAGVGAQTGVALSTLFTRVAFGSADAAVAFCGLDPRPKESGKRIGRRRLSKQGDQRLRALLYNAASSASRTLHFKGYYRSLRARGLATTEALVVLARKLLRIAYGVWRTKRPFDPAQMMPIRP